MNNAVDLARQTFLTEAGELLETLEDSLLELEKSPSDFNIIGSIFRAMHTIKGSGAMFGFDKVEAFTHDIETVYDKVREGQLPVTKDLVDLTLQACDQIKIMLYSPDEQNDENNVEKRKDIILKFSKFLSNDKTQELETKITTQEKTTTEKKLTTYKIQFIPNLNLFEFGTNPILLIDEIKELGTTIVFAKTNKIPSLSEINPENCYVSWEILLISENDQNDIKDVFIFVEDDCKLIIEEIDVGKTIDQEGISEIINIFVTQGSIQEEDIIKHLKVLEPITPSSAKELKDTTSKTLPEKKINKKNITKNIKQVSSIRVDSEKLDSLFNYVGELVIVQASLSQAAQTDVDAKMLQISEELERLTRNLRDMTMSIRMVPVGTLFNKFKRLVRDLSNEVNKKINFEIEGDETELDKSVIERLNDPLIHLIRNSVDHGIELPEDREKNGKNDYGTIHLSAYQQGAEVVINITDDGKGLDVEKIKNKALQNNVITENSQLSDKEIFQLIFAPGFSTAEKVTSVSGRGVGMDVVKQNIVALRGKIDIESSKNKGTSVYLKLPLTLGIIEGLLVRIDEREFVLPLATVDSCEEILRKNNKKEDGRQILNIRGDLIPYVRLRNYYSIQTDKPDIEHMVISEINNKKIGFIVDEIIGEQQVVIKPLGKLYKSLEGISGATILGDGNVALIVDVPKLSEMITL